MATRRRRSPTRPPQSRSSRQTPRWNSHLTASRTGRRPPERSAGGGSPNPSRPGTSDTTCQAARCPAPAPATTPTGEPLKHDPQLQHGPPGDTGTRPNLRHQLAPPRAGPNHPSALATNLVDKPGPARKRAAPCSSGPCVDTFQRRLGPATGRTAAHLRHGSRHPRDEEICTYATDARRSAERVAPRIFRRR
jgi:hypothetical protein